MTNKDFQAAQTYGEILAWALSYIDEEHVARWLLRERLDWEPTELYLKQNDQISQPEKTQYKKDLEAYQSGRPAQYIVGREWFYGYPFKVDERVLIPRPETELLVEHYLKRAPNEGQRVLDIGTGSGAIACTVKKERPQDQVFAVDLSQEALDLAQENAQFLDVDVDFYHGDLLEPFRGQGQKFDAILSNPPYIAENEWDLMDQSVKDHEPREALFAEKEGLALYKSLAKTLPDYLEPGGLIALEIGFRQGRAVADLFKESFPQLQVEIHQDYQGLDRNILVL